MALSAVFSSAPARAQNAESTLLSLAFADTDLHDAFRLVARQSGVNVVVSNKIDGTITLDLDNASLDEALKAIADIGGFQYSRKGNVVTVQTIDELLAQRKQQDEFRELLKEPVVSDPQTLVLSLRYIDAERIEPIVKSLLSETGTVSMLKTSDHIARERGTVGSSASSGNELQIGTRLSTSTEGEPAKSHTLVVIDERDRLARIKQVVADIDIQPRQVVIEARFVEISLDSDQRLGIDWNVLAKANGGATPTTIPFGSSSLGSFNPNVVGGSPGGVFPHAPNSVTTPGTPGLFTFGTLDFTTVSAMLEMVRREADVRIVSNPSIVVRDRHTATILVGERYPILSANVSEYGTVIEQLDRYEPIGVQLAVTPSVIGDEVELLVRPSTSSLGADVTGSTGLSVARINSRQIDTLVTVEDGQTVVIGGLITTRDVETQSSVPFFGSLPILGRLFQHKSHATERVDLVVFLTVSIAQERGLTPEQRRLFKDTGSSKETSGLTQKRNTRLAFVPSSPQF